MKTTVAVLDKEGYNVVERVLDVLNTISGRQPSHFGLVSPKKSVFEKSPGILSRQGIDSSVALGYVSSKPTSSSQYEFLQFTDTAIVFEGKIYAPIPKKAIMEDVAKEPLHCEALLHTLMANADGDYSFLIAKDCWIGVGRDPVGVQPLYYSENKSIAAIATNRKALWLLGHRRNHILSARKRRLSKPQRLPV